ncbi:MAG: hypothetical protein DWI02_08455, partial [Planctomycetota bacterium]
MTSSHTPTPPSLTSILSRAIRFTLEKRQLRECQNLILIVLGVFSAAMGLHGFLLSSNFIDGGVTGVSMLLVKGTGL